MRHRIVLSSTAIVLSALGLAGRAQAQDVPGIEICTVEKTMERRTSCLQSNVNFLQQTIGKLRLDQQQKLDAAVRQIEALNATVVTLQKAVADLQAGKPAPPARDSAKDASARDTPAAAKDAPAVKDAPAAKDSAK